MLTPPLVSPYAYPEYARAALTDLLTRHVDFDRVAPQWYAGVTEALIKGNASA